MANFSFGPEDSRSSDSTEEAFANPVRAPFLQTYRINALRVIGGIAFLFLSVTSPPPTSLFVNILFEIVGAVAIFTAIAGRAWCLLYIGGRKNSELVTFGPYSMTRNRLYLFSLVGIAGVGGMCSQLDSVRASETTRASATTMQARSSAPATSSSHMTQRMGSKYCSACHCSSPRLGLWKMGGSRAVELENPIVLNTQ